MNQTPSVARVGRPSTAAPFARFVMGTIMTTTGIESAELLRRARVAGYGGGKSAFYALVAQLREKHGLTSAAERRSAEAERRQAERQAKRERLAAEANERSEREGREREARLAAKAKARQDRRRPKELAPAAPEPPIDPNRLRAIGRAWLRSRENTHKNNVGEWSIWRRHLEPAFGELLPIEVDVPRLRTFIEAKLATGLTSTTVGRCVRLLSSLFTELVEQGTVARHPVRAIPKAVKRLYRNGHDPRSTPFIENMADVKRLRAELPEPLRTLYTVGVLSGLRTGELLALRWADLRHDDRAIHVQRGLRHNLGIVSTPKSGHGRIVPLAPTCTEVLREWRRRTDGDGLIFKPFTGATRADHLDIYALITEHWRPALARVGLPPMRFYEATRHTFASQWVLSGQPIEKLSKILGHSSVLVTERYAHLKPEALTIPDVIDLRDHRVSNPTGEL
ncbi:MAG TPA: site-specific integrase [Polyangia bacterium]|nr:site-specific integrase [Polyangia bacterium]